MSPAKSAKREERQRDMGSEICPVCGEMDWSENGGLAGHSWVCDHQTKPGRPSDDELELWAGMHTGTPAERDAKRFAIYLLQARSLPPAPRPSPSRPGRPTQSVGAQKRSRP